MNNIKRILSALLASTFIITAAACAEKESDDNTKDTDASDVTMSETDAPEEEDIRKTTTDDIPEANYDGHEFHMYSRSRDDFVSDLNLKNEKETGELVEDALYKRNRTVEERFDIKLSASYWETPVDSAKKIIGAGDDEIGLVLDNALNTGSAIPTGYYMAWDDLPYNNLTKPWYIKNVVDAMSINGHTYMMAGEFNISLLRFTYCMYYNKNLAATLNVNNLYEDVVDMKWTYDKLYNTVKIGYNDLDGDGDYDPEDRYGLATDFYGASTNYQYAFGVELMHNDDEGIPQLVYYNEKTVDVFDKIWTLLFENEGTKAGSWGEEDKIWGEERALFVNAFFQSAMNYRDYEFDFGLIPYPMYNENQGEYRTHSNVAFTVCGIPITTGDINRTSAIVEALQAESWRQVIPAYYDIALKVKYTREEDLDIASDTLDLILAGRYLDFGVIYDQSQGCATLMQQLFSSSNKAFTSTYEKKQKQITNHYQKLIDKICDIETKKG